MCRSQESLASSPFCRNDYHGRGWGRKEATPEPDADPGIDLNTATLEQLITLPGIGPVKAQAIVDYREGTGQFQSIEEVTEVRGIGPATYEGIRDLIRVGKAPP